MSRRGWAGGREMRGLFTEFARCHFDFKVVHWIELSKLSPHCSSATMARLARVVVPGLPHHVTQRGNRRERVFFEDGDQLRYLAFLTEGMRKSGTAIWAYCL